MKPHVGILSWKITIHESGLPPEGGCLPALIEWNGTPPQYGMASPGHNLIVCISVIRIWRHWPQTDPDGGGRFDGKWRDLS